MATITIKIPDGDTCVGCDHVKTGTSYYGYGCHDKQICGIFGNELKNRKKCIGCKICMMEDKHAEKVT